MSINIGDVVVRPTEAGKKYRDIGDVVEKNGERCRVAWRDIPVPNFYRPEETTIRKGKRTWVNQKALAVVAAS